jgi:hypothetical protein
MKSSRFMQKTTDLGETYYWDEITQPEPEPGYRHFQGVAWALLTAEDLKTIKLPATFNPADYAEMPEEYASLIHPGYTFSANDKSQKERFARILIARHLSNGEK